MANFFLLLWYFQFITCLIIIIIATIQDINTRLVYDWVWICGGIVGTAFHVYGLFFLHAYSWNILVWNIVLALIFDGLVMIPKLFGGTYLMGPADLLGILFIAYILPTNSPYAFYNFIVLYNVPIVFTIITNTFALLAIYLLGLLWTNVICFFLKKPNYLNLFEEFDGSVSLGTRFVLFLIGKRVSIDKLENYRFVKLLEEYNEEEGKWEIFFNLSFEDEYNKEEMKVLNKEFHDLGLKNIWISPMMPLMVFLLGGVILSNIFGNVIFKLLESVVL